MKEEEIKASLIHIRETVRDLEGVRKWLEDSLKTTQEKKQALTQAMEKDWTHPEP